MRVLRVGAALFVLCAAAVPGLTAAKRYLGEGEGVFRAVDPKGLTEYSFANPLKAEERSYLGLKDGEPFPLAKIGADLVLLEFLNVYCYACVQQVPVMNEVHRIIQSREDLRDRVRFFGVAVGNGPRELAMFKEEMDIPYPIIPDPEFKALDAIGNPGGTPFLILYPTSEGIPRGHLGMIADPAEFIRQIEAALAEGMEPPAGPELKLTTWRNLDPGLTKVELEQKLRESAAEAGLAVAELREVEVEGEKNVYRLVAADGSGLWAKVAGRAKVCNVCHDIFFILLFDDAGEIVNFTPILVTKYQNELINDDDAAFMRNRLLGKSVADPPSFDHEVDAITQATMSSELIFDTVRRLQTAFKTLPRETGGKEKK